MPTMKFDELNGKEMFVIITRPIEDVQHLMMKLDSIYRGEKRDGFCPRHTAVNICTGELEDISNETRVIRVRRF